MIVFCSSCAEGGFLPGQGLAKTLHEHIDIHLDALALADLPAICVPMM